MTSIERPSSSDSLTVRILRFVLSIAMVAVGALHFVEPASFVRIVPPFLPAPEALVAISGVAEIAGGIGILIARFRRAAGMGLIALYICVFPANVYMAVANVQLPGGHIPTWALWTRLPFQFVFIAWAWFVAVRGQHSILRSPSSPS